MTTIGSASDAIRDIRKGGCRVCTDDLVRDWLSVDASSYRIRPLAAAFPKRVSEVQNLVKACILYGVPIIPRGAGTGLVGGALGRGIVVDFGGMTRIMVGDGRVTVQPGVPKGVLDAVLERLGLFVSPDPSIGRYCSVGGMVATNASGAHALKYGSVIDNLISVVLVDGNGRLVRLPGGATGRKILGMAKRLDRGKCPHVSKNSCGYRLDAVHDMGGTHLVVAGSEGTLGLVVSATFRTRRIPPKKTLTVLSYSDCFDMAADVSLILKKRPAALECLDEHTVAGIPHKFADRTRFVLFVEFDNGSTCAGCAGRVEYTCTDAEISRWWGYRNSALGRTLGTIPKERLVPHVIEDASVPVERLPDLVGAILHIDGKFGTRSIVYGHAGDANLHVRLVTEAPSQNLLVDTASAYFGRVLKLGGTITAEHGDGLARSPFVRVQYGDRNYALFAELKKLMDPHNILNPDKIITDRDMTQDMGWP